LPLDGAEPFIGRCGTLEQVEEVRLETIVPEKNSEKVVYLPSFSLFESSYCYIC